MQKSIDKQEEKCKVSDTSTSARGLIFHYEDSVRYPQTLVPLEC
jgi:hypothetical protein